MTELYSLLEQQHPDILELIGICSGLGGMEELSNYTVVTLWHIRGGLHDHLRVNTLSYSQHLYPAESNANGLEFLHAGGVAKESGGRKAAIPHQNVKSRNITVKDDKTACNADSDSVAIHEPCRKVSDETFRSAHHMS